MLHLKYETPPAWAQAALADPEALLIDHAFCEDKAAAAAHSILRHFPAFEKPMKALAKEEEGHARQCRALLKERGVTAGKRHRDLYVSELRRQGLGAGSGAPLDRLLVCGLIEARSCERFRLLADACTGTLARFYEDLFAAEARHHVLFVDLAADLVGERKALQRLSELGSIEANIAQAQPWAPRIH